jgi:hypothetical protein
MRVRILSISIEEILKTIAVFKPPLGGKGVNNKEVWENINNKN